ncbi:MAG: hypothetical protein ACQPRI_06410, partial [Solitalea-like symbiont of Tyrophagus putrescentiae]
MTDKYMSRLGHRLPELKPFLKVLDIHVKDLGVKSLYKLSKGNYAIRGHNKSYNLFYDKYDKSRFKRRNYVNQVLANDAPLARAPGASSGNNPRSFPNRQQGNRGNQGFCANQANGNANRNQGNPNRRGDSNQFRANNNNNNYRANNSGPANANAKQLQFPCMKCNNDTHSLLYCQYISAEERLKIAKDNHLCLVCLKRDTMCLSVVLPIGVLSAMFGTALSFAFPLLIATTTVATSTFLPDNVHSMSTPSAMT